MGAWCSNPRQTGLQQSLHFHPHLPAAALGSIIQATTNPYLQLASTIGLDTIRVEGLGTSTMAGEAIEDEAVEDPGSTITTAHATT